MGKLKDMEIQAWIRAGKPIAGKPDGGGLAFTLSANGTASWVFRYRIGGKMRAAKRLPGSGPCRVTNW